MILRHWADLYVLRNLGARGLLLVAAAAKAAGPSIHPTPRHTEPDAVHTSVILQPKRTPVYKIAIAGASTLVGRELKEALEESSLAAADFVLLDEEDAQGQLDQVGDEVTFVQAIGDDAFERVDFTFFCGAESLTRKHWRLALRAGSTVLDLSGALDQETGVLVRAPWLASDAALPTCLLPPWSLPTPPP